MRVRVRVRVRVKVRVRVGVGVGVRVRVGVMPSTSIALSGCAKKRIDSTIDSSCRTVWIVAKTSGP